MGNNYAPKAGDFDGSPDPGYPTGLPFGQVFQCPSLPPPDSYHVSGGNYPQGKNNSSTNQSYGLRTTTSTWYYPGEKQPPFNGMIKYSFLYKPSQIPYMDDNIADTDPPVRPIQDRRWDMGSTYAVMQLRHNRRANIWCPDGHGDNWGISEATSNKCPGGSGILGSTPIGYSY